MKEKIEKITKPKCKNATEMVHLFCNFIDVNRKFGVYTAEGNWFYRNITPIAYRIQKGRTKVVIHTIDHPSGFGNGINFYRAIPKDVISIPVNKINYFIQYNDNEYNFIENILCNLEQYRNQNNKCLNGRAIHWADVSNDITKLKNTITVLNKLFNWDIYNTVKINRLRYNEYVGWTKHYLSTNFDNITIKQYLKYFDYSVEDKAKMEAKYYFYENNISGYSTSEKVAIWLDEDKKKALLDRINVIKKENAIKSEAREKINNLARYTNNTIWAKGDNNNASYCNYQNIRIIDNVVKTTGGAVITIPEGKLIYALFKRCIENNEPKFNINKMIGYYTLNSIEKEYHTLLDKECWVINIGCHKLDEFVIDDFVKLNNW